MITPDRKESDAITSWKNFFKCVELRGHDFDDKGSCTRCKAEKGSPTVMDVLMHKAARDKNGEV